eukprot:scaffold222663_cov27-Tisochrysis_lutea.AAC.2
MDDRSAPGTDPRRRSRVMYGSDSLNGGAAEKSTAMWQDSQHDTGDVREEAMLSASATAGERRDASPGRSPVSPGAPSERAKHGVASETPRKLLRPHIAQRRRALRERLSRHAGRRAITLELDEDEVDALPCVGTREPHVALLKRLAKDGARVRPIRHAARDGRRNRVVWLPPLVIEPLTHARLVDVAIGAEVEVERGCTRQGDPPHAVARGRAPVLVAREQPPSETKRYIRSRWQSSPEEGSGTTSSGLPEAAHTRMPLALLSAARHSGHRALTKGHSLREKATCLRRHSAW